MSACSVPTCNAGQESKLFKFPNNTNRINIWKRSCAVFDESVTTKRICSRHFSLNDLRLHSGSVELRENVNPTLNLPTSKDVE